MHVHMLAGRGGDGGKGKGENPKQTPHGTWTWAGLHDSKIMTLAQTKGWLLKHLSHSGAPQMYF